MGTDFVLQVKSPIFRKNIGFMVYLDFSKKYFSTYYFLCLKHPILQTLLVKKKTHLNHVKLSKAKKRGKTSKSYIKQMGQKEQDGYNSEKCNFFSRLWCLNTTIKNKPDNWGI